MLGRYDEDLQNNSFYKEIRKNHLDIIEKVVEERWIICVPKEESVTKNIVTEDILDHILIPDIDLPASHLSTLSKKRVLVQNETITPQNYSLRQNIIKILFQETYYNANSTKYTVWCIDRPLNDNITCTKTYKFCSLVTLQDCIEFLCNTIGDFVHSNIQGFCEGFISENPNFAIFPCEVQKEELQKFFLQCLEGCSKEVVGHHDPQFVKNFNVAVETCMQYYLRNTILNGISNCVADEEAQLNKIIQNLSDLEFQEMDISPTIGDQIFKAKCELSKIDKHNTILGKLCCLRNTFNIFSKCASNDKCFTCDDLLQILVYVIVKLPVGNWITNLKYISEFKFTRTDVSDENSFLVATLEAAIHYIKSGSIFEDISGKMSEDYLCKLVKNSQLEEIRAIIKNSKEKGKAIFHLCHPLCSCATCENLFEDTNTESTVNSKRQTLLHIAVLYNKLDVVEIAVEMGCDVNATDNFGETPLHYAAKKGHQTILLFLIQNNAKTNEKNREGNTPLHLAVSNGHERCTKALIFCSEDGVNDKNNIGNTPLHIAAKLGYLEIIKVLIEGGASVHLNNFCKLSAKDVALNYHVVKALHCEDADTFSAKIVIPPVEGSVFEKARPESTEQQKKIDRLLKAIQNNDLPLTCFYLGIPNLSFTENMATSKTEHHPLCSCDDCKSCFDSIADLKSPVKQCDINSRNLEGYTPLHVAAKYGRTEILRLLLETGAACNPKTCRSLYTPLHLAAMYQKTGAARELLKNASCEVDAQDSRGNTPLFYACSRNDVKMIELLLTQGANTRVKNQDGVTALREAERKMLYNVVALLKGVDGRVEDEELFGI